MGTRAAIAARSLEAQGPVHYCPKEWLNDGWLAFDFLGFTHYCATRRSVQPARPVLFWATAPVTAQPNTAAHRDLRLEATLYLTRGLVITRR